MLLVARFHFLRCSFHFRYCYCLTHFLNFATPSPEKPPSPPESTPVLHPYWFGRRWVGVFGLGGGVSASGEGEGWFISGIVRFMWGWFRWSGGEGEGCWFRYKRKKMSNYAFFVLLSLNFFPLRAISAKIELLKNL